MDANRWEHIQAVFHRVADLPHSLQEERLRFECGEDAALFAELQAMLQEDASAASPLDSDLPVVFQHLLDSPRTEPFGGDFAPYQIIRLLGEGGMGVVYLAKREDLGNLVAIKVLRDGLLSPSRQHRFESEQRTLAKLKHPSIAQVYDAKTSRDGSPWFVMEYVEGKSISDYSRELHISVEQRLRLFRLTCEAVEHAHRQAVIHRDLKPSNILVRSDGTVKLLDFGIAKQLDPEEPVEKTTTGFSPMTLPYASPEQILGETLTTQTDVYSLGVILYELLTARLPFDLSRQSRTEAERIILGRQPEAPSGVVKRLTETSGSDKGDWRELDVLCLTAMHKDPQRRYGSVEALIRDIDHYLQKEPLDAQRDSFRYRLGKFAKRNRRSLTLAAMSSALFIGLVVFFVARINKARNLALAQTLRTQRIERFTLNLFSGGDKAAGPSDDLRVVTLLDRGVVNARTLNSEPGVQADLYQTLGTIYQSLGRVDKADSLLRDLTGLNKATFGPESPEFADALVSLGLLRLDQGQLDESERLVREALAINRRHLAAQDPAVARAESALGRLLADRGAYNEAVGHLTHAMMIQSANPQVTTDLSDSTHGLADAQYYLGHLDVAETLNKRALKIDTELYGEIHPRVADDLFGLGEVQHDLAHDAEAEEFYRRSLAINQSWYGSEHPRTALSMAAVGQSLVFQAKYDQAAPVLQNALAIQERTLGKLHPQVAMGLNTLGLLEIRRAHLADAEGDFVRMRDINRSVYGDRHYLVGIALLNLGQVYLEEKRYTTAEEEYREAIARFKEQLPPGHPSTAIALVQLGHVLTLERRDKEAEAPLLEGLNVLSKQPGPQAPRIQKARADLVTVYEALGKPQLAAAFRVH